MLFCWFFCSVAVISLQGRSSADKDTGLHGMGQFIAMLTAYVGNKEKNNIIGFTLSPVKVNFYVQSIIATLFVHRLVSLTCLR